MMKKSTAKISVPMGKLPAKVQSSLVRRPILWLGVVAVLPVLAMTADALTQDVDKALQCGMNAHIAKPIIVEELYTKLYYYLFVAKVKII